MTMLTWWRRWRPGPGTLLVAAVLVAAFLVVQGLHFGFGWLNPFGTTTTDRSGPVVLKSIQDLSRYEAAEGQFQVIVDLDKEAKFLPGFVHGTRTLFVGNGSVNAYVDFSKLTSGALTVSADRKTAAVRLPHAQLEPTNLDPKHSYVFATQTGLLDKIGQFFGGSPSDQRQLYVLAAQKIQTAAQQSGLQDRADQNTKTMIQNLLKALGFTTVAVTK
jgi:Protein of unknown function (DUF4230)